MLINNAGVLSSFKKAIDIDLSTIEQVMNTNFYGAVYGSKVLWDVLQKSKTPAEIMRKHSLLNPTIDIVYKNKKTKTLGFSLNMLLAGVVGFEPT